MTDDYCVCEHCGERAGLYLYRSPLPIQSRDEFIPCHAVALCWPCGQESGLKRFFDPDAPVREPRTMAG